jgi:hypothetical protein
VKAVTAERQQYGTPILLDRFVRLGQTGLVSFGEESFFSSRSADSPHLTNVGVVVGGMYNQDGSSLARKAHGIQETVTGKVSGNPTRSYKIVNELNPQTPA